MSGVVELLLVNACMGNGFDFLLIKCMSSQLVVLDRYCK